MLFLCAQLMHSIGDISHLVFKVGSLKNKVINLTLHFLISSFLDLNCTLYIKNLNLFIFLV